MELVFSKDKKWRNDLRKMEGPLDMQQRGREEEWEEGAGKRKASFERTWPSKMAQSVSAGAGENLQRKYQGYRKAQSTFKGVLYEDWAWDGSKSLKATEQWGR